MDILADECIPSPIVRRLRDEGMTVTYVLEDEPGTVDSDVLARANVEGKLLLTEDRDFGHLVYARQQPALPGVVYLRLHGVSLEEAADAVVEALTSDAELRGRFTTVDGSGRIRQRPLP